MWSIAGHQPVDRHEVDATALDADGGHPAGQRMRRIFWISLKK
jgi:hypothetical protein